MADDSVKVEVQTAPVANDSPAEPNVLETTTAKDGHLPINNGVASPIADAPDSAPVVAPETPITVTDAEVSPTTASEAETVPSLTPTEPLVSPSATASPNSLSDEVESLSGEIQALEAKIDRLTGNVKPVGETSKIPESVREDAAPPAETMTMKPETTPPPPVPSSPSGASRPEQKTVSVNDIYSKGSKPTETTTVSKSLMPEGADVAEEIKSNSGVGAIGEALSVVGVLLFVGMTAFPFYEPLLSSNITDMIRTIGWPTAVGALLLGFILSLFGKGSLLTKIFTFLLLILAVVMYLGVSGYQNFLGPLGPMLDSVFTFYR